VHHPYAESLELDVCHDERDPWEATADALVAGLPAVTYELVRLRGPGGGWPLVRFVASGPAATAPEVARQLRVFRARYAGDERPDQVATHAAADDYRPRALSVRDARRDTGWRFVRTTDDADALAGVSHARQAAAWSLEQRLAARRRGAYDPDGSVRVTVLPTDGEPLG
jgi:hypothetical protein